jgi:hypothetical protein
MFSMDFSRKIIFSNPQVKIITLNYPIKNNVGCSIRPAHFFSLNILIIYNSNEVSGKIKFPTKGNIEKT